MDNFIKRLSGTDLRLRRKLVKYGFLIIGLFFLYSVMSGTYGIPRIVRLEMERNSLIQTNRAELADLIDSERIRDMLLDDADYIEFLARTRYHMVYPNEIIYRYRGQ